MDSMGEIFEKRHEYAREWKKRTGGKVLGYYEPYFPEELAYAAGILPVRIMAEHLPDDVTDRQMYGNCYVTRDMLNQFLNGRYDYIDGLVGTEGCQWMYNAYQTVINDRPDLFNHYMFVPDYVNGRTSKDLLVSEMEVLKGRLEEWIGKKITDEAIDNAIEIYNKNRALLRQIYELRRADKPVLLGSEAISYVLASQIMDKAEANELLEKKVLPELWKREPLPDRIRLILLGSETFDCNLEKLIEDCGANVVIDELDNGTGYVWNDVVWQPDRLMALSLRYLGRPHHPLKDNTWRRRPQHIFELCEDWHVDGAIIAKQIYCHPHGTDNYIVWRTLRERGIPYHFFERDTTVPIEETAERINAFLEMLKPGLVRLYGMNQPATLK